MASPACVDLAALLAPLAGAKPAGVPVPFAVRQKLDEARKEIRLEDFRENDPLRPAAAKPAEWPAIVALASKTLTETSKDLLVAARLVEALPRVHGPAGLRDGLCFLRRLYEECWDRIYPEIEEGDLEVRATQLNWLDDPVRGARFPTGVRDLPLLVDDGEMYSLLDWRKGMDAGGDKVKKAIEKAVLATPRDRCQNAVDDLAAALQELEGLKTAINARLGDLAPGLLELKNAIGECQALAAQILERKGPAPVEAAPAEEAADAKDETDAAQNGRPTKRATTREEVYEQLAQAAATLQTIEPHSPIPYLIQRAVELGRLPFPQLIKVLVREPKILTELNRELGIKDAEG